MIARLIAGVMLVQYLTTPMLISTAKVQKVKVEIENVEITKETYFTIQQNEHHISNDSLKLTTKYEKEIAKKEAIRKAEEAKKAEEERQRKLQQYITPRIAQLLTIADPKERVAQYESGGRYDAVNGKYYGRYQLDSAYLNGDFSIENQERTAEAYVQQVYTTWEGAWEHIMIYKWY